MEGCTSVNINKETNEKKVNAFAHSIEQVMYTRNLNIITLFSFNRNLVLYSVTNSKELSTMNKKWEGCGSSRTLSNMICEPVPPLECPNEDLFNTINNNQKVSIHSGHIREGSKVPVSVCTSMCHIVPQPKMYLQYSDSLNPENWRNLTPSNKLLKKVKELKNSCVTEFQRYRGLFIEEMIKFVVKEQKIDSLLDYVDIAVANEGKINTCSKCSNTYIKEISICPSCQFDANNYPQNFDLCYRTVSKHLVEKPIVDIGKPCMVNPNSFDSLKNVLNHVSATNKLSKNESNCKWTLLICDGVPYTIPSNLQDKYLFCNICKEEIKNMVDIEELEKMKSEHAALHQNETCTFHNLFHNIILLPGPGHLELNMGRLLLKLLWVPFLNKIVEFLGFYTEKAQLIVKNGIDHHRT